MIASTAGQVHHGEARSVRNYWNGHWTGYPIQNNLRHLPSEQRVRALTDLVAAATIGTDAPPSTYREWCLSNYGTYLTDEFYEVFTAKYWRRHTTELATDWLTGRLIPSDLENIIRGAITDEVRDESKFAAFQYPMSGGFFGFFRPMYDDLDIHFERRVTEVDLEQSMLHFAAGNAEGFDTLVSSIPLPDLITAIKDVPGTIRTLADRLRHTKMRCINIVVDVPELTDSPWCYIYDHDIEAARVSFPGNLAPGSLPRGTSAIQAEVFRAADEDWNDVDGLTEQTVNDMANLFGFDPNREVRSAGCTEVPHAYVVADHDRATAVAGIVEWLRSQGVYSMGLYGTWKYLWSDDAYRSGTDTASRVKADHGFS
jgi:protoporphyrinogen oxidase